MKIHQLFRLITVSVFACVAAGSALADQIILKNGDRITGSVVKKGGKDLSMKSDNLGVVTVSWDDVQSITTDKPVTLVLQDGRTVAGAVSTADGTVTVKAQGGPVTSPLAGVTALRDADEQQAFERLQRPGWGQLWSGTGTIGFAGTSGNAKTTTFTVGATAARTTNNDKTSVYFNAIKASARSAGTNADTAQAIRGGIGYDHNLTPRLFVNVFNDWEYDKFQALDLRFVVGGGLGFHAVQSDRHVLDLLAGADYNHSKFSTPLTRNSAEIYWGDEYNFKTSSAVSLVQSYRMFNDLTNTGTYRVNFDAGLSTKIAKWLTWNVSLSDRYLNDPAPGRKTNDLLYTTGLGITFAK